jgi:putative nucleotidyltransferase with HDIG domain
MAAAAGGLLSGVLAVSLQPIYQLLLGEITKNRLVELEDLSNPLLKQIAEKAPGTWQHSLAMANMAEIAANSIAANALLCRVGAYYHDLGKSLQPQYYIENLVPGSKSPHDSLPPETSADAIFAHVTEGVRVARNRGLPEPIIDFMHMHHGDGLLEYFWGKCQEEGNPRNLDQSAFRYPGVKPQSRETAILAICDALEAASRTIRKADGRAVEQLVQRIVYGKLHLGQLDESGLSVAELQRLASTLVETLKHANHGRIEYPWQKEERDAEARQASRASAAAAPPRVETSGRFVLDSADSPQDRRLTTGEVSPPTQVVPLTRRQPPGE